METFDTVMMMNKNFQGTDTVPYQHLHAQLLSLKDRHTNKQFDLAKTKAEIRSHLVDYRSRIPDLNGWRRHGEIEERGRVHPSTAKNVVFYSFLNAPDKVHIMEHEYKRLRISWKSLRKYNSDIEVRFCLGGDMEPNHVKVWEQLCDEFNIKMYPFADTFSVDLPNAWCIHRWYNMGQWKDEDLNLLYLDADTLVHSDIQLLFDVYSRDAVYGREEIGFRFDPNSGVGGEDPRFYLDLVDASIVAQGGIVDVHKYCLGVILLNHSVHRLFTNEVLDYYSDLLKRIHRFEAFYSIPNYRIMDEFAFWVLLSRLSLRTSLFGNQDVSQTFLEQKHETHFNPIVLHYTTKDEEKFADWSPEYSCLSRSEEVREDSDMGAGGMININPMMWQELEMSMWRKI